MKHSGEEAANVNSERWKQKERSRNLGHPPCKHISEKLRKYHTLRSNVTNQICNETPNTIHEISRTHHLRKQRDTREKNLLKRVIRSRYWIIWHTCRIYFNTFYAVYS